MTTLWIIVIFGTTAYALAYRANGRFQDETRLPMQWWLTGEVTWSAPRRVALAFMPVLTIVTLGVVAIASPTLEPGDGQQAPVASALVALGITFIAVQLAHYWLIARSLRRRSG